MRVLTKPYPTFEDCQYLWEVYQTPPHVIRHCQAVSRTAVLVGEKMNEHGYAFDLELLAVAGWLHDLMRLEEDHGGKAAEILRELGYDSVAELVKVHMRYHLDPENPLITETDILCFADRLVIEDKYAGLDRRMEYIIEKSKQYRDPVPESRIRTSFGRTKVFQKNIEEIIQMSIENIEHMMD